MYEVEVKVESPHGPVRERLESLDAEPLGAVRQRDTYYDHPARSFAETDEALRLRRESTPGAQGHPDAEGSPDDRVEERASLTYKGPLVDDVSKTREEHETAVGDPTNVDAILRAVGFEPAGQVEKERERFGLDGYLVALDSVRGLGEFVEIEARGDDRTVEDLREGAFDRCRRLGLDPGTSVRRSYLALLLEAD